MELRKFLLQFFVFLSIAFAVSWAIGLKLSGSRDLSEYFPARRWNEFYAQPRNSIDLIFAGSSYCYRSCVPEVFDSTLHVNSFNLGSSNQTPMTTYYILKEALRYQKPKYVIVEASWNTFFVRDNYLSGLHNIDFIKSVDIRASILITHFSLSEITEYLVPAYRFNNYKTWMLKGQKKKIRNDVGNGVESKYYSKGYVASFKTQQYKPFKHKGIGVINLNSINQEQVRYFEKIASLCRAKGVTAIWYVHPVDPLEYSTIQNYTEVRSFYEALAKKNEISFIDFNDPEFELSTEDFYDPNHLTHIGAIKFSRQLSGRIRQNSLALLP